MDIREEYEENPDRYRNGATEETEPSASPQPPILKPEIESPRDLESPFGSLAKSFPDVIQKAKGFYARHPTLVKAVGTVFVAAIARRLFRGRPGLL
jgi:hypothetical protein